MKKTLSMLGVAAVTAIALSSCSQEEVLVNNKANEGISFRARIPMASRADITTENLSEFAVTAFYADGTPFFSKQIFSKEMVDDAATGFFTCNTIYFWPTDGSEVNFFASAPKEGPMPNLPHVATITADEFKIENFAVEENIDNQTDFVIAHATGSKADEENGVKLTFEHALAKISVIASSEDENYTFTVKGVKIGSVPFLMQYTYAAVDGEWTHNWELIAAPGQAAIYKDFTWAYDDAITLKPEADSEDNFTAMKAKSFMLIPQALEKWDNQNDRENTAFGAYLGVLIKIENNKNSKIEYPYADGSVAAITEGEYAWVAFPIDSYWESGYHYTYKIDFTNGAGYVAPIPEIGGKPVFGSKIKFTMEVSEWESTDDQTVFGNTDIDTGEMDDPFGDEGGVDEGGEDDPFA